jgi:hypothetical protein
VLAELSRVHNSLTFRVLGTATLVTESGQEGEVQSQPLGVKQTVYVQGDSATADTELRYVEPRSLALARQDPQLFQTIPDPYAGNIKLKVTLERGEFLVLGENTVQTVRLNGTLFYIAHWPASE